MFFYVDSRPKKSYSDWILPLLSFQVVEESSQAQRLKSFIVIYK